VRRARGRTGITVWSIDGALARIQGRRSPGCLGHDDQPVVTASTTIVDNTPLLCDVTANPASTVVPRLTVAVDPARVSRSPRPEK
jgi:hypothetical protein